MSSAQITMPGATPDAAPKRDGLPVSFPFKDLLLGLHQGEGVTPATVNIPDPITATAGVSDSPTDLTSFMSDESLPLPAPQVASNSAEKDAVLQTPQDAKPQQDCPCVPLSSVEELQAVAATPTSNKPEVKKSDRKTDSLGSTKVKPSLKRITASSMQAVPATIIPTDATAMKVIATLGDCNAQPFPVKTVMSTKSFAEAEGTPKLIVGSAMIKTSSVKFPVAIALPVPQGDELIDQADKVVASALSPADDHSSSHESIAAESGTKVVRATSLQETSFVASSPQPAVVFHPSLVREEKTNGQVTFPDDDSTQSGVEASASSVASAPMNHLDLQWKDGALGNVSVRAEMREGALHAIVNSSHAGSAVSATELHQFLEESRIPVHSLQVNGAEGAKHIAEGDRGLTSSFDANTSSGSGAQASLSYRDESSRSSARGANLRSKIHEEDKEMPVTISSAPVTLAGQAETSRLSIHI